MNKLYQLNHDIIPDEKDEALRAAKEAAWNKRSGPRVGDFVRIGGRYGRFSHDWGDEIQWSPGGSFYHSGEYVSFSGGLNGGIPKGKLTLTDETRDGDFWFFHHGASGAHRAVGCRIPCRVWRAETQRYLVTVGGNIWDVVAVDHSDAWGEGLRREREDKGRGDSWYPPVTVKVLP